jgi:hypothetical protein
MRQVLGWALVCVAAGVMGCGSSSGSGAGTAGSAGTSAQAGSSGAAGATGGAGTAGSAGNGGSAGGAAGSGGGGSGGVFAGCFAGTVTPTSPTVTDFTPVDGGASIPFMGGPTSFGTPSPEVNLTGGNLHAQVTVVAGPEPQTVGFGIYFGRCIDAGAYSGVKFDMSGTVLGCTMTYAVNFSEDDWNAGLVDAGTGGGGNGACTLGMDACYPPSTTITATNQTVAFSAVSGGSPAHAVDKNRVTGMTWQFAIDARPDGGPNMACSIDVIIDNIVFVP